MLSARKQRDLVQQFQELIPISGEAPETLEQEGVALARCERVKAAAQCRPRELLGELAAHLFTSSAPGTRSHKRWREVQ